MFNTGLRDRVSWRIAMVLASVVLSVAGAQAKYGGGSGTAEDPYQIWTAEQMNTIGAEPNDWDKHFKLMTDLDLSAYQGNTFHLIGYYALENRGYGDQGFSGVFDGNGHAISNFTYLADVNQPGFISRYGTEYPALSAVGLFRYVWLGGEIKNLGLIDPLVEPAPSCKGRVVRFGALVGEMDEGSIINCYVAGGRVAADSCVGGLVGDNHMGTISGCYTTCNVAYAAGRPLWPWRTREVPLDARFGGLVGMNEGEIRNSYALGAVQGDWFVGGLVGGNATAVRAGVIADCFAAGPVSGTMYTSGLVGLDEFDEEGMIRNSFWDQQTTGQAQGLRGGTGKTTSQMQDLSTYLKAGWDFVGEVLNGTQDIWMMDPGPPSYPKLAWQQTHPGGWVDPDGVQAQKTVIIYHATLAADPGWTTKGQWQFGRPAGLGAGGHGFPDPNAGYTGANIYGVNLAGDYRAVVDGAHYLTAGPFDCSRYREVKLQFARWLNTDQADFVRATVEVSNDDGLYWRTVWAYDNTETELTENAWTVVLYSIDSASYQRRVYIRWGYEVLDDGAWAMSGWNIDDIVLTGTAARP